MAWFRLSVAALGLAVAGLSGCMRSTGTTVPISGVALTGDRGTVVDVSNYNGSVRVLADPGVKAPVVKAHIRTMSRGEWKEGELVKSVDMKAVATVDQAGRVLRVTTAPAVERAKDVAVDLTIRVPRIVATTVKNSGGPVELVRVSGPVNVENGAPGTAGGDVQVRTGAAMTGPSTLVTSRGKVLYQVGPGSTGKFDLTTDKGPPPEFSSRIGELAEVRPTEQRYTCVFNKGENPILLRSGDGLVRATVMVDAGEYGPELWDGSTINVPAKPRFLGRLAGEYNDEPARLWPKKPAAPPPSEPAAEQPK